MKQGGALVPPSEKKLDLRILGISSLTGIARGLVFFPVEQPVESLKVQWQAKPVSSNEFRLAAKIYREKGLKLGFYSGSLPNLGRIMVKSVYRYPIMIGLPKFYQQVSPKSM